MFYSSPFQSYRPPSSYYDAQPSQDDLARARYLRALQEQRAARQAYVDALAAQEVQRLEEQYSSSPYIAMNRRANPYLTGSDDEDDQYAYAARWRELERRRRVALEEHVRQDALEAEEARRAAIAARRAREAEFEERETLEEAVRTLRAQRMPPQQQQNPPPQRSPPTTESSKSPALSAIDSIAATSMALRNAFAMPEVVDFAEDSDSAKLSYASANRPIRAYEEALNRLLERLDAVESAGVEEIRDARRKVAKAINGALKELDGQVEDVWRKNHEEAAIGRLPETGDDSHSRGNSHDATHAASSLNESD